jgi:hypothetical protein
MFIVVDMFTFFEKEYYCGGDEFQQIDIWEK